jgi:integrase
VCAITFPLISRVGDSPYIFPGARGRGPWQSWGIAKTALSARMPGAEAWEVHDLRRTARSLMSRAGVRPDIAERVLGHVIGGVAETYDRHSYRDEKAAALAKLAALIEGIVNPRDNVVALARQ